MIFFGDALDAIAAALARLRKALTEMTTAG
jgi:hypothetical protein